MLALEAAKQLRGKVSRLALYEVPCVVDDSRAPAPETYAAQLDELIAAGRRAAAVKLFMSEVVGLPSMLVAALPVFPGWSKNKACAHTLAYDAAVMGDTQRGKPLPTGRWTSVTVPTLVADGGKSPAWMRNAATQLADALPNVRHRSLDGQAHNVKADALAPVLSEFLHNGHTRVFDEAAAELGRQADSGRHVLSARSRRSRRWPRAVRPDGAAEDVVAPLTDRAGDDGERIARERRVTEVFDFPLATSFRVVSTVASCASKSFIARYPLQVTVWM